jgi:hypothetical protein
MKTLAGSLARPGNLSLGRVVQYNFEEGAQKG